MAELYETDIFFLEIRREKTSRTRVTWELFLFYFVLFIYIRFPRLWLFAYKRKRMIKKFLSSDNSAVAPPDPIPNSEVKRSSSDGSVGVPMWE